jgi:hypothetical protein
MESTGELFRALHHWPFLQSIGTILHPCCLLFSLGARRSWHLIGVPSVFAAATTFLVSFSLDVATPKSTLASHPDVGPRRPPKQRARWSAPPRPQFSPSPVSRPHGEPLLILTCPASFPHSRDGCPRRACRPIARFTTGGFTVVAAACAHPRATQRSHHALV